MTITERFIRYTQFDTQSCEDSSTVPSTAKQLVFARFLRDELIAEGLSDVEMDDMGYIYATLKGNTSKQVPTIGFIAHYATSPDCSGANVKAQIVKSYDGKVITQGRVEGMELSPEKFPELLEHIGEDLIITDGTTLLGADDKAGIAEIMQAMVYLREHPEIEHGDIRIAFNPDEEIGMGAHHFNVEKFGCDWAYTMDGGDIGELEYENFNAASAKIRFTGTSVHPGYAKGKMINAARIATEFAALIPSSETPENTEGYDGFFHLTGMEGNVEKATLSYIIRDHNRKIFEERKKLIQKFADFINIRYDSNICEAVITDQYYNMKEKIAPQMHIIDNVLKAMEEVGVKPKVMPIRGGTDGAQLSFMGLPCPNIFAGGVNFHGPYEFISVQVMEKAMEVIIKTLPLTPPIKGGE